MKYLVRFTALVALAVLGSCAKKTVTPVIPEPIEQVRLFNFRVAGFITNGGLNDTTAYVEYSDKYGNKHGFGPILVVDTCRISVNGIVRYTKTYGYEREFKIGDTLTFIMVGKIDSSVTEHSFAIWEMKNELPKIHYFYAQGNKITGQYIIN